MDKWFYRGGEFTVVPEGVIGFVYNINNLSNNKNYIGKKNFYKTIKKTIKGRKNKKKIIKESDWKKYCGSNAKLIEDINNGDQVRKEILTLCTNKSEMSYIECKYQIENEVLLDNNYYNEFIGLKLNSKGLKNIKEKKK